MTGQLVFFSGISHAISANARYVFAVTLIAVADDEDGVGILCADSTAV